MSRRKIDVQGQRFGFATVLREDGRGKQGHVLWLCQCDCGNLFHTTSSQLIRGMTKSCGCYSSACTTQRNKERILYHTEDEIRLSRIWKNMIARCEDCGATAYSRYGARGITVCEEWHSFEAFKAWAFTSGYESTLTIDRKDNNGGYCPENCRWATDQEQNCNKRNNRNIEYNGEVHNIAEWAKILDKRMSTLHWRLVKAGWSVERAFTTPCAPFSKNHNQEI